MLRFSPEQAQAVIANRRQFNQRQAAMNADIGVTAGFIGNAAPVPKDVWGTWDREAVELQRSRLAVFNDLAASVATPMPIGKLIHYFQTVTDSGEINVSLDGRSKAKTDQPMVDYHGTPLPIIDTTFSFGWRQMAAAATEGYSLDPAARMNANRRIAEQLETAVLEGYDSITVNGEQSYGLRNHPNRNTRSTGVTLNGASGPNWLAEVNAVTAVLYSKYFFDEPTLYVNINDWKYARETDYSTQYANKTIAQRVMESGIGAVVPSSSINANEIIAVVKRRDVLQVLNGMPQTTRAQFRANPEDDYNFVHMAAAALEIKFDAEDNCGIVHSS